MSLAPPLLIASQATSFSSTSTPKTLSLTVASGDLIVVGGLTSYGDTHLSVSGGGLTWTKQQEIINVYGYDEVTIWTAIATSSTTFTLTATNTGYTRTWGVSTLIWRNHGGVGASAKTYNPSGGPSLALTTTLDNSAVAFWTCDDNSLDGASRVWRNIGVAATETVYTRVFDTYTAYAAYYSNAGTVGVKTVGLSAPVGQTYVIAAIEIKGRAISIPGIADTSAVGTPTIIYGTGTLSPTGITSSAAIGTPMRVMPTWRQLIDQPWWADAITAHQRTVGFRAEMINAEGTIATPLPVTGASVTWDSEAAEQWACSLTVAGSEWVPRFPTDVLDPRSGLRCRLYWRLLIGGVWAEIPVGTYTLEDPQITDNGTTTLISVTGRDVLAIIRRGGYGSTVVKVGGLTIPAALERILTIISPKTSKNIDQSSTVTLPEIYELTGRDPLEDLANIAAQAGLVIYSDREGNVVGSPVPNPVAARADWQEGANCPVIDLSRNITTSEMVNSVTVVSTNPEVDPPVSVTIDDDDESSPTWIGGNWGRRGVTIRSDAVAGIDGAMGLAQSVLDGRRRPVERIAVTVPTRPDLGYMDRVLLARYASGVAASYRVSKWSLQVADAAGPPPTMSVTMMAENSS